MPEAGEPTGLTDRLWGPEVPRRRRVAVDKDDLLNEFTRELTAYLNERTNRLVPLSEVRSADLWQYWDLGRDEAVEFVHEFIAEGKMSDLAPNPDAQVHLERMSSDYELILVTAQPLSAATENIEWTDRFFPGIFSDLRFTNQLSNSPDRTTKSEICFEVGASALLDDSLQNVLDCCNRGIPTVLFDRPWNRGELPSGAHRVRGWEMAERTTNVLLPDS